VNAEKEANQKEGDSETTSNKGEEEKSKIVVPENVYQNPLTYPMRY